MISGHVHSHITIIKLSRLEFKEIERELGTHSRDNMELLLDKDLISDEHPSFPFLG